MLFSKGGFALPTVLIASVVMLIIMATSVTSVVSIRTAIKSQYYEQLARAAGEAGVAYAKACLAKNGNVPQWTDAKPLTPSTDCAGNQLLQPQAQVLVVAGGGGGGGWLGGGGGGGGVVSNNAFSVSNQVYTVTVGAAGGAGAAGATGGTGGNSVFGSITALGGGGGGGRIADNSVSAAATGGSGGGGAGTIDGATTQPAAGANGTAGQGNKGGNGSSGASSGNGGGGGGASSLGGDANGTTLGAGSSGFGGNGYLSDITGSAYYYGGGGSGGRWGTGTVGVAGLIGAGAGGNNTGSGRAAGANTGGGGGGGGTTSAPGGAGGSGVVIVRYPANGSITATASNVTATTEGAYRIFRFTSSGTFTVSATANSSCPTDPRCSVVSNGALRSTFSVGLPTLNNEGEAVAIPNNGSVELVRPSDGTTWRTYKQPSVQAAVVPDFCSGQATSVLGWGNAVAATQQDQLTNASSAESITLTDEALSAGRVYFRKDFPITVADTYTLTSRTSSSQNTVDIYVDGTLRLTNTGTPTSASFTLNPGCHTITARLSNEDIIPRASTFTAVLQKSGGAPIVATDTSWRVSAGTTVHFSEKDYYRSASGWVTAQDSGTAQGFNANWTTATADATARALTGPASTGCGASCPANSYLFFKDTDDIVLASATRVRLSAVCDDSCVVYINGKSVLNSTGAGTISQQNLTLPIGTHSIAVRVSNTAVGQGGMGLSLYNLTTSAVISSSDSSWYVSNVNVSNASPVELYSYEDSFRPSPNDIP